MLSLAKPISIAISTLMSERGKVRAWEGCFLNCSIEPQCRPLGSLDIGRGGGGGEAQKYDTNDNNNNNNTSNNCIIINSSYNSHQHSREYIP